MLICELRGLVVTKVSGTLCVFCFPLAHTAGYDGDFCESDFDACANAVVCDPLVTCIDNPPPSTNATCGPCPAGYAGDGTTCAGEDMG